jgi:Mce-associated membrane protein
VLSLGAVIWFAVLVHNRRTADDRVDEAVQAARQIATDISTYDYRKADEQFQHLLSISTGDMRKQVEQSIQSLVPLIKQGKARATGQVRDAAVTDVSGDPTCRKQVCVMAVVDQSATNSSVTKPSLLRYRFLLVMKHEQGKWLVSNLTRA